jgi:8-oxo-dGTP diphosphatase
MDGVGQAASWNAAGEPPVRVLAAVIERRGAWLLCLRPAGKRHAGHWEFPGGKLEPSEDLLAAARRELREELGVEVESVGSVLLSRQDPGSPFVIEFVDVVIQGEPRALEHQALCWADGAGAARLPLAPADRAFMDEYLSPPT